MSANGYPFALHLAARAISGRGLWALPDITAGLSDEMVSSEEEARARMLDLTYAVLRPDQQRALLSLALLKTQTFYPWMVAAMADLTEDEAWRTCEVLADHRLVERVTVDASGVVQLRILESVRVYIDAKAPQVSTVDPAVARQALAAREEDQDGKPLDEILAKAVELLGRGRLGEAVDEARGALAEARRRRDVPGPRTDRLSDDERHALAVLAEAMSEVGGLDDAREMVTASQRGTPNDSIGAYLWRTLGQLLRREWRLADSVKILTKAADVAGRVGNVEERIACLREAAIAQSTAREFDAASQTLSEALRLVPSRDAALRCRLLEARALDRLNRVRSLDGPSDALVGDQLATAIDELEEAFRQMPDKHTLWAAWILYHRALIHLYLATRDGTEVRTTQEAFEHLIKGRHYAHAALEAFSTMSHKYGVARCRLELGRADRADGNHRLARAQLEEARETLLLCGDRWLEAQTAYHLAELRVLTSSGPERGEALRHAEAEVDFAVQVFEVAGDETHAGAARALLDRVKAEIGAGHGALVPGRAA